MDQFWVQGVVKNGQVVLENRLDLPDGTVVTVMNYDPDDDPRPVVPTSDLTPEFIQQLAGMWADRPELRDPQASNRKCRGGDE